MNYPILQLAWLTFLDIQDFIVYPSTTIAHLSSSRMRISANLKFALPSLSASIACVQARPAGGARYPIA
jgi:hypothetical protein